MHAVDKMTVGRKFKNYVPAVAGSTDVRLATEEAKEDTVHVHDRIRKLDMLTQSTQTTLSKSLIYEPGHQVIQLLSEGWKISSSVTDVRAKA